MDDRQRLNFVDILASTLHDTKNAMGMVYSRLEEMEDHCRGRGCPRHADLLELQYEIQRLNSNLIRLLALYKAERTPLKVNCDLHNVSDFLDEVLDRNEPLLARKGIAVETDCPSDLFRAFDKGLVTGILDNVLNNAFRYAKVKVLLAGRPEGDGLLIEVSDDGPGYPPRLLMDSSREGGIAEPSSFLTGNTGLGLYFALLVARAHRRDDREGYIRVTNGGALGGGCFALYLP